MSATPPPIEMFYSYADADEPLRNELEKHLSLLKHEGLITTWHHRQIIAGTDWSEALDRHLNTASIILLLISSDFVASDYCYGTEMQRALQRHERGEAHVIPILLRPVDWQSAPFGKLKALPSNGTPITRWRNRDAAFADVTQSLRIALEDARRLTMSAPSTTFPHIWDIPYPRNPVFTGREEVLTRLADTLKVGQPTALPQPQAISGLGGIGKTQIAVEYAYRYRQNYQTVLWTRAETREALVSGYVALAERLNLPEKDKQDPMAAIEAVLRWLKTHTQWLLILDNADDLSVVCEFLPSVFGGHIVLTTRAQAMGRLANRVEVEAMEQDVATLFLLRRASLIRPDASLEQALVADIATARMICEELGGLPLALDQAGAYIEETQCTLSDYHKWYQIRRAALLQRRGGLVADHPEPVATTWSLAFEKIAQKSPAAADLLRCCAFLHPDAIPEEIFTAGAPHLGSSLQSIVFESFLLDEAISVLSAYSLLRRNAAEKTVRIHRLVQAVLKDAIDGETHQQWARLAVLAVNEVFPDIKLTTWSLCERYLPHAQVCADLVKQADMIFPEAAHLLHQAGRYLYTRGRYAEAEPFLRQALTVREQLLGLEHPGTARIVYHLAELQKKYEQAEPLLVRALAIYEQRRGPEYPGVSDFLNRLAHLYEDQGKHEQAEALLLRALAIDEQAAEPEHRYLASTLHNLAYLYHEQRKYEQAEPLLVRALALYEQQSGPEDPGVSDFLTNLARLYQDQGKYEQAEPLFARALAVKEHTLGPHHQQTETIRRQYASLLQAMGREAEAIQQETRDQDATPPF